MFDSEINNMAYKLVEICECYPPSGAEYSIDDNRPVNYPFCVDRNAQFEYFRDGIKELLKGRKTSYFDTNEGIAYLEKLSIWDRK